MAGISLRAIARDMGMSSPALYNYFPSLDTLITALTADAYDNLRTELEKARDAVAEEDTLGRLVAVSRAFRRWALDHSAEFRLAFDKPSPARDASVPTVDNPTDPKGLIRRTHQACGDAEMRFGAVFTRLFADLWTRRPYRTPELNDLDPTLCGQLQALAEDLSRALPDGGLPVPAVYVYLSCWTHLYGLVAIEVFGHQRWALTDAEPLFETELTAIISRLEPA